MIIYEIPRRWIGYSSEGLINALAEAKGTILALKTIPYQRQWLDRLQELELKREVAGTSRIEGADFTDRELDEALKETPAQLMTRSQRQAHAAVQTYRWISALPDDRSIDGDLIREIHRRIVTGADDDHCPPGELRGQDQNVTFGAPRHRGAVGGQEVARAFAELVKAIQHEFRGHDPIVQAMAAHYHISAIHPFLDGNGRTARALEALLLRRAGLRETAFIAMSNYYYDEKSAYLNALAETRKLEHNLTPFLRFALQGVAVQGGRLLAEIRREMQKELFRSRLLGLFSRLESQRRRVIGHRQIEIVNILLEESPIRTGILYQKVKAAYAKLKEPALAFLRDIENLQVLQAIRLLGAPDRLSTVEVNLQWPTEITDFEFFEGIKQMPQGKTFAFLRRELK